MRQAVKGYHKTDSGVLFIREYHEDGEPFWTLPGGGLEDDETHEEALVREIDEELGCGVEINRRLGTVEYDHRTFDIVSEYVVFEIELEGEFDTNDEIDAFGWFDQVHYNTLEPIADFIEQQKNL